ncbi:MAG: ABC transporter ATP-binding protein [Limnochordia bacterium]|mgnify:CR=1 FL=1
MIRVAGLTKAYNKEKWALRGISFEVQEGEFFGFLGPNGAGKTTAIKILTGQLAPTGGEARVMGWEPWKELARVKPFIGVVPDQANLYERLTLQQNLELYCRLWGLDFKRIDEVLERVGLLKEKRTPVKALSRGMKQRALFARAVLHRPRILFLDEPTSGLDPVSADRIHRFLEELNREGMTIFLTSHNMQEVDRLCHRVAFLSQGIIAAVGAPGALKLEHSTQQVRVLVEGDDGALEEQVLALNGTESAEKIGDWMRRGRLRAIHSQEPSLAEIFIKVTGQELV